MARALQRFSWCKQHLSEIRHDRDKPLGGGTGVGSDDGARRAVAPRRHRAPCSGSGGDVVAWQILCARSDRLGSQHLAPLLVFSTSLALLTVMSGWAFDVPTLRRIIPGQPPMVILTALGTLLLASALLLGTAPVPPVPSVGQAVGSPQQPRPLASGGSCNTCCRSRSAWTTGCTRPRS